VKIFQIPAIPVAGRGLQPPSRSVPKQRVTAIKLSLVGAGRARDDGAITLQSLCKYRGRGPLLRSVDVLNLMAVTQRVGTRGKAPAGN